MTTQNQQVLFYVLVVFFVLIGISSLFVLLGYVKAPDKAFRKWAVTGFAALVTTAVIGAFKLAMAPALAPIVVTLRTAEGTPLPSLRSGEYHYDEITPGKANVVTQKGPVVPVLGEGGWQVQLPGEVSNKVIQLLLRDDNGAAWETGPFYPNYVRQEVRAGKPLARVSTTSWDPPGVAVLMAAEARREEAQPQPRMIKFNNYARRIADRFGRPYYEWRVFADEPASLLDTIARVDYVLHPTFPEPFQSSRDRSKQFELRASGWGSFTILITVRYADGREAKTSYVLDLGKPWPADASKTVNVS